MYQVEPYEDGRNSNAGLMGHPRGMMVRNSQFSDLERQVLEAALARSMQPTAEERAVKIFRIARNNLVLW